jgi:ABC-type nitrate/sulfonate/bicarbonate transport system permease component
VRIPASVQHWIVPLTVLVAWEALGRAALLPRYLSVPTLILAALWEVAADGELLRAVAASLYRVAFGLSLLYSVPKIAFLPIFLLLFGLGHASKISIIAFSCFFPVFIASRHAALAVSKVLVWSAQNMGAPRGTMFFRVFVPAAAPQLFGGIRIGLAHSFVILFAAELIGSQGGLGTLITEGEDAGRFDLMFAGIVTFAALGFVSDRILMAIRRHVLRGQMIGTTEQLVR